MNSRNNGINGENISAWVDYVLQGPREEDYLGGKNSGVVVAVDDDVVAKVYTRIDPECPSKDRTPLGNALWEASISNYVHDPMLVSDSTIGNRINSPELYSLAIVRGIPFLFMERVPDECPISNLTGTEKRYVRSEMRSSWYAARAFGLEPNDIGYHNIAYSKSEKKVYTLDFVRWDFKDDSRMDLKSLESVYKLPVLEF